MSFQIKSTSRSYTEIIKHAQNNFRYLNMSYLHTIIPIFKNIIYSRVIY